MGRQLVARLREGLGSRCERVWAAGLEGVDSFVTSKYPRFHTRSTLMYTVYVRGPICTFVLLQCRYLEGLTMPQATAATLTALTGASCNDGEHSLEMAELLGDALLKYATSVHVFLAW